MRGTILKTKWPNEVLTNRHPLGPAKRICPAQRKAYQRPIAQDVTADRSSAQDFGHGYRYRLRRRVWWRPAPRISSRRSSRSRIDRRTPDAALVRLARARGEYRSYHRSLSRVRQSRKGNFHTRQAEFRERNLGEASNDNLIPHLVCLSL